MAEDTPWVPLHRPRRTRQSDVWRRMVRETRLSLDALIYPLFVVPGRGVRHAVQSMPGIFQLSVDEVVKDAKAAVAAGVPAVLLFAAPAEKDAKASSALTPRASPPRRSLPSRMPAHNSSCGPTCVCADRPITDIAATSLPRVR